MVRTHSLCSWQECFFKEPDTERIRKAGHPQYLFTLPLDRVTADMQSKADALRHRIKDQIGHLERHRNVVHNAWVVAGTRIPTKTVWRYYQAGYDADSIIRDYPLLTPSGYH
jgi:uncharacterized protein (DUF433 family)